MTFPLDYAGRPIADPNLERVAQEQQAVRAAERDAASAIAREAERGGPGIDRETASRRIDAAMRRHGPGAVAAALAALDEAAEK